MPELDDLRKQAKDIETAYLASKKFPNTVSKVKYSDMYSSEKCLRCNEEGKMHKTRIVDSIHLANGDAYGKYVIYCKECGLFDWIPFEE
jgi:hypothetical protein